MSQPLVSVCVVTYQHGNYIKQCLDSILSQKTDFNYEIILGEDESTDGTREICQNYAEQFPNKIRLFLRSRKDVIYINGKPTGRYNFIESLKQCRGKYIALCEGDDYWTDDAKLQKQVDFLEANNEVSLCFTKAQKLIGNEIVDFEKPSHLQNRFNYVELLKRQNFIATASVMFNTEDLSYNDTIMMHAPLGDLALYKILTLNEKIGYIEDNTAVYRIHNNGLWSGLSTIEKENNYLNFYKILYPLFSKEEKNEIRDKSKLRIYKLSRLKFPNSPLRQFLFKLYYRIVYRKLWL